MEGNRGKLVELTDQVPCWAGHFPLAKEAPLFCGGAFSWLPLELVMAKRPHLKNHDTPVAIDLDGRTITGTGVSGRAGSPCTLMRESTGPGRSLKIGGPTPSK
jgi:hypothetical protein